MDTRLYMTRTVETAVAMKCVVFMVYYSTRDVAKFLKIKPDRLQKAIWLVMIDCPQRSPSGTFLWTLKDIEKAAWALHLTHVLNQELTKADSPSSGETHV